MKNKKGVSPVIATVLIVLITFVAVGIFWSFILPMIRGGLEKGASCFDLRDYVTIVQSEYTCYDDSKTTIMIQRGMDDYEIEGIVVSITSEDTASSTRYDLTETSGGGATLYGGGAYKFPSAGETKTYVFINTGKGNKADLGVMSKGGICEMGTFSIPRCIPGPL